MNNPEPTVPTNRAIVEVDEDRQAIVEKDNNEAKEIKNETVALIDAIRTKASSEAQKAGEFTREKYLEAVRNARTEVEKMEFDPEQVEESIHYLQQEAEKNWDYLMEKIADFGDRLETAAKAAWDALLHPDQHK